MLALSGFDAVIVDLEHGPASRAEVTAVVAAAQGAGLFAIARLGSPSEDEVGRVLDAGVDGLVVPHVASQSEAEAIVRAGRFPPIGERSINPYTRGNAYGVDGSGAYAEINGRVALIAMVEGAGALSALEAIARTPELDGIFVGPVDLSSSLGFPGEPEHPQVVEAVRDVLARIRAGGVAAGVYAPTPEAAARWLDAGAGLVALSADSAMLVRSLSDWAAKAKAGAAAAETGPGAAGGG
jgi:4-hydroxy-2-oxoheptanedioate aldolase